MRTRNTSTAPKKTPPAKKAAVKSQSTPSSAEAAPSAESPAMSTPPPNSCDTKLSPSTRGKQPKSAETLRTPVPIEPVPKPEPEPEPAVEEAKSTSDVAVQVTGEKKPASGSKTTRRVVKRVIRKTVVRPVSGRKNKSGEAEKTKENDSVEPADQETLVKDAETAKNNESNVQNVERPAISEEPKDENVEGVKEEMVEESSKKEEVEGKAEESLIESVMESQKEEESACTDTKPLENQEPTKQKEIEDLVKEQEEEEVRTIVDKVETMSDEDKMEEDREEEMTDCDGLLEEDKIDGVTHQDINDEPSKEEFGEDEMQEQSKEVLEEERAELHDAAKERKLRKELEIFVGGLDRDVVEEDLKKVFQHAGEVVDVRLHKDPSTNKNKGYAFVRFATKEQANRALSEMKNPVIRGKRCGTAPSEDNDTLFVGNICNTWTKEAIKQKLKEYGIEGVEKITLVADTKHEGLSRGFAFLEFSRYSEAMLAYKRLQKPDAVFGHSERTVKVAFAEPLREPDPEVMAQVKSVFIDGLPPHWDEDRVRETFKRFGEIARITLARNMSSAKRKDYGFVDFTSHEAAVACIEVINNTELGDGNSKTKVRARLSNPLPKTLAVKDGMAGGFRIARGGGGVYPRFGRGLGRGGHTFNRPNFQHGRGFYPRGPGRGGRTGFLNERELDDSYPFHGRQNFGHGGRWSFGPHQGSSGGPLPNRPNLDRIRHGGHGDHEPLRRHPFPPEEGFNRPYHGRHSDDSYFYDETAHGMKRPYFMTDPDYVEPSTRRPRFEYSEASASASASFQGTGYRDAFGADRGPYQQDYYGSDYAGGVYPSRYGDRPYGRGYYY
ncbi:hypothetical protein ACH5RR_011849 [Cinchona calisaya]|uniref:RRM domain-containing protein n=1 Tax=Cinchona calisaya TaxID=153742 RepID=A0ABD3ABZ5_9GENT